MYFVQEPLFAYNMKGKFNSLSKIELLSYHFSYNDSKNKIPYKLVFDENQLEMSPTVQ